MTVGRHCWRCLLLAAVTSSTALRLRQPPQGRRAPTVGRRAALASLPPVLIASLTAVVDCRKIVASAEEVPGAAKPRFRRPPLIQYIAALGDPAASSGTGADKWGLWVDDPGPRGVRLNAFEQKLVQTQGNAPAGWRFDVNDWWLEEHGLIMPGPDPLPARKLDKSSGTVLPARRYVVTGDRELTVRLASHEGGDGLGFRVRKPPFDACPAIDSRVCLPDGPNSA